MKHSVTKTILAALAAGFTSITAAHAQVSCGATITGKAVMTSNLFCLLSNPVVTIDGGDLDMNGYTIGCAPGQDGVAMINSGGKVRNGSIEGCDRGVVLAGSGKHTVKNVSAKDGAETGFFMLGSGNKMIGNTASGFANDGFRAATAFPPLKDKFVDNIAANNGGDGFDVDGDKASFTGNVATGNTLAGFAISGDDIILTRNTAYDNGNVGIAISGARAKVSLNTSIGNVDGLQVLGDESKVKSNLTMSNGSDGLLVNGTDGKLSRNVSVLNAGVGIFGGSSAIQLSKSAAVLNGDVGIWIGSGSGNIVTGNRSTGNASTGVYVTSGTTSVSGNYAYDNPTDANDLTAGCATNTWVNNIFGVKADACIQ